MPITCNPETEADRVRRFTSPESLRRIEQQIERNVEYYGNQPDEVIAQRIEELKREWSINRMLQANVATVGFLGAILGLTSGKKWALLTLGAFSFFLFHGLRGWDPPLPLLRRIGVRTRSEIDREIYALKVARGDFRNLPSERKEYTPIPAKEIMRAVNS
jgi:hypothetical protein